MSAASSVAPRVPALDIFRGLVLFLLLPDLAGGFSFYAVARAEPDSAFWGSLARWFTHVEWVGFSVWDLVMPAFVFALGAAMPFSYQARRARGDSRYLVLLHAAKRSFLLFILGMNLLLPMESAFDYVWPFVILSLGLPMFAKSPSTLPRNSAYLTIAWFVVVCGVSIGRLAMGVDLLGQYNFAHLLMQVALAYPFAFLLIRCSIRTQIATAAAILIGYGLAFQWYPTPSPDAAVDFPHWQIHTNAAAAFDGWLLNALPRAAPYVATEHGYQTLTFVPLIVNMLIGSWIGAAMLRGPSKLSSNFAIVLFGAVLLAASAPASVFWAPLVKSLWTPSWTLFSSGMVVIAFALVRGATSRPSVASALLPLAILGSNSLLLYVLAGHYRWFLIAPWNQLVKLFPELGNASWWVVAQSMFCLASLFIVATLLYRRRLFVRM